MQSQYPQRRKADDFVIVELDGEVLIYDKKTNKAFNLNETSALIWELCDGRKSLPEISRFLGEKLNAPVDDGLVWLALDQLRQADLIEHETAVPDSLAGLSRRQAIRKVGLAAVITLPFISSLVAPTAMNAQSTPRVPPFNPVSVPTSPIFAPIPIGPPSTPPIPRAPTTSPIFAPVPLIEF